MRALRFIAASALLAGCGFNFERSSEIVDRRILAIQSDPAEIVADNGGLPPTVQLKALVVDPVNDTPTSYEWRVCIQGQGLDPVSGRCDETVETTLLERGVKGLGELSTTVPVPPQLGALVQGLAGQGIGASVYVTAQLKVDDPNDDFPKGQPLYAIKRIVVSPPLPAGRRANQNPRLSALLLDGTPWDPTTPRKIKRGSCEAKDKVDAVDRSGGDDEAKIVRVCAHKLAPAFDPAQGETYVVQALDGEVLTLKERLRFGWFSDAGSFSRQSTAEPEEIGPQEYDPLSTKWQEPITPPAGPMRVWVVVRDGRGGVSWETRLLEFEP